MRVEVPPQVIPAAAARVRPTSYVYVPGLARDNLVLTPCRDRQEFLTKIRNTFGLRMKTIWQGSDGTNEVDDDAFMTRCRHSALFNQRCNAPGLRTCSPLGRGKE